jgi:hypothetical protein
MTYYHSNKIFSAGTKYNDGRAIAFDVDSILSDLEIKYSIYNSKEDFDSTSVYNVTDMKRSSNEALSFCSSDDVEKAIVAISRCNAKVILCHKSLEGFVYPRSRKQQCLIFVNNPRLAIMKIIKEIYYSSSSIDKKKKNRRSKKVTVVSPTPRKSKTAQIGNDFSKANLTIIKNKLVNFKNKKVSEPLKL